MLVFVRTILVLVGSADKGGIALALHSVADVLGTKDLPVVMTILISRTLGLIIGSAELREKAALCRGGLIEVTSEQALKEFFIPITGFPWQVKSAILSTLSIIIQKGGLALKPFLPQLQTTFDKCLQDNTRTVRSSAALALGKLSALTTRIDPLTAGKTEKLLFFAKCQTESTQSCLLDPVVLSKW
ncbi:PREDICTED: eIF-2-alpha kinase activator GCN1-like isoform X3 [Ipomoea nil]|uniref:eIF-2-alpha kinase activator GCN1-like isoform X3 n=1 Tax=Ipomoea nil TaxID=35883 RepID=UPI00090143AC|nr:PREDICTED: eIF-2-alpha kinase activator GCN1-like isoform X3 [Ipomoea nil]